MFCIGSFVRVQVPYGPNAGQPVGCGTIHGHRFSGIDGNEYLVQYTDGRREWTSEIWLRK